MKKSLSFKNIDAPAETSQHGSSTGLSTASIRRNLSNVKLSKSFSKTLGDHAWSQDLYPVDVDEYELKHVIGKGASATVWLAECIPLQTQVAIKLMDLENFGANLDIVMQEAMIMRQQRHPNVLPLLAAFLSEAVLWMVMPYVAGGSVIHILNKKCPGGFEEPVIATIAKSVLSGLHYMHPRGFIHRDIKGENVLVDEEGNVMLADFGVTAAMEPRPSASPSTSASASDPSLGAGSGLQRMDSERSYHCYLERHTFVGTPCFMAPEVMEQEGYYQAADIWAFGILLMELATGHAPYANFSLTNIIIMTMHSPVPELERTFSEALRDVVAKCLDKDPEARPTAAELLKHKFFKLAKDPGYIKDLLGEGGTSSLQHSSSANYNNSRKTVGKGMRSLSSKKSMQYNAMHAVMSSNATDARKVLKKVTKGTWTNKGCTIDPCSLTSCAGVAFTTLRRMEGSTQGFGNGFVLARMEHENGNIAWSAPSYFDLMVPGAGAEFSKVELCFVVPDDATLSLFTKGTNVGMELPRSRDVELGLASRSDLINILNNTLHGGKTPTILSGGEQPADAGILNKAMFESQASMKFDDNPSFRFGSQYSPGADSPGGGLFRMDSEAGATPSQRRELQTSPSALFPVSLSAIPSSEEVDPALETRGDSVNGGSNSMFSVNDTAMDSPSVLQAGPPPPSRPTSPPLFQHAQQQPPTQPLRSTSGLSQTAPEQREMPSQQHQQQSEANVQEQMMSQPSLRHQLSGNQSSASLSALSRQGSMQLPDQDLPSGALPTAPSPAPQPRRKLYAFGIADPEYMSLPCKMSMKHARVTVNHETNNRLYGKKLPGQILGGQVEAPVEFLPLYDVLATMPSQCAIKTSKTDAQTDGSGGAAPPKAKGVFKKLFSKKS